ncbi:DUF488 domain-containing protein [Synergistaceae bacterium OttesenSCG-928-I11]|nr:DUF488 domain-containing protein [Synergistaceae bacterium OttesenSCG-928-I11]
MGGLFTIGYSAFAVEEFISVLVRYRINAVIDVRSQPYASDYYACYNKESIQAMLKRSGIRYLNYAKEFGARQTDLRYFSAEGYLDFELFSKSHGFLHGFNKLKKAMEERGYMIALMCAEKNPATCHRSIMVSRAFYDKGYEVSHILAGGSIEGQCDIEQQLLEEYFPDRRQLKLFDQQSTNELIVSAYKIQNAKIGYRIGGEGVHS